MLVGIVVAAVDVRISVSCFSVISLLAVVRNRQGRQLSMCSKEMNGNVDMRSLQMC